MSTSRSRFGPLIASTSDVNATFDSFDPPHEGFRALKRKLAELRANSANASADDQRIADGTPIKPGAKDDRVPQLRSRLKTSMPADTRMVVRERGRQVIKLVKADEFVYDKALYNAVRNIQANADIKPTGVIDSKTIAAINGPKPSQVIDHVLANMERWRWLPRDLGQTYVMVNVPDYTLKVVNDHREAIAQFLAGLKKHQYEPLPMNKGGRKHVPADTE